MLVGEFLSILDINTHTFIHQEYFVHSLTLLFPPPPPPRVSVTHFGRSGRRCDRSHSLTGVTDSQCRCCGCCCNATCTVLRWAAKADKLMFAREINTYLRIIYLKKWMAALIYRSLWTGFNRHCIATVMP